MALKTEYIRISYHVTFAAPFHCGTGLRAGVVDRTVVRDQEDLLYIPGSTFKGLVREECERLARFYGIYADDRIVSIRGPHGEPEPTSPHDEERALGMLEQQPSIITRIFGARHYPSQLSFHDVLLSQQDRETYQQPHATQRRRHGDLFTDLSTQVRLDRPTRTAVPGALYTSELGTKELTFTGSIHGWLRDSAIEELDGQPCYGLLLLLGGLLLIDHIGSNKSTGKGECRCTIDLVKLGKQDYSRWEGWFDHLALLANYLDVVKLDEEAMEA